MITILLVLHADLDLVDGGEYELPQMAEDHPGQLAHWPRPWVHIVNKLPDVWGLMTRGWQLKGRHQVTEPGAQQGEEDTHQGALHGPGLPAKWEHGYYLY